MSEGLADLANVHARPEKLNGKRVADSVGLLARFLDARRLQWVFCLICLSAPEQGNSRLQLPETYRFNSACQFTSRLMDEALCIGSSLARNFLPSAVA